MSDEHKGPTAIVEHREPTSMSPVVRLGMDILRENPNPETLRELLAVQREFEAGEAKKAYALALVGLKRDLPTVVERDKVVAFGNTRYTHASLAAVMDAVTIPLTAHGFSLTWHPATTDVVSVTCRLTHSGGHSEEVTISAPPDTSGAKSKPQAVASTITLLSRYAACSLLGIATADHRETTEEEMVSSDKIDSSRNLRAVGRLRELGKKCEDAEEFLGKKVKDWSAADLDKLREWTSGVSEK